MYTSDIKNQQHRSMQEHRRIGVDELLISVIWLTFQHLLDINNNMYWLNAIKTRKHRQSFIDMLTNASSSTCP